MMLFGTKGKFALEIGEIIDDSPQLRYVACYASGQLLTPFDTSAYLPSFIFALECDLERLKKGGKIYEQVNTNGVTARILHQDIIEECDVDNTRYLNNRFMDWGPTCDDVGVQIFQNLDILTITCTIGASKKIHSVEIGLFDLIDILERSIAELKHPSRG